MIEEHPDTWRREAIWQDREGNHVFDAEQIHRGCAFGLIYLVWEKDNERLGQACELLAAVVPHRDTDMDEFDVITGCNNHPDTTPTMVSRWFLRAAARSEGIFLYDIPVGR